ncbi:MAG TPA: DUF4430 domain-containing protein [Pirellulales bacterium]|jgi:hypothetical protein|nr:DUF4430 domain-containing protein [Pirellulales bacterium]
MAYIRFQSPAFRIAASVAALWLLATSGGCQERAGSAAGEQNGAASAVVDASKNARNATAAIPAAAGKVVDLVIDYGDGAQKRFTAIAWREGMTVFDALEAAKAHPHGIAFSIRGAGEQALLTKIDDLENQKGAAGAKDWIFYVNDHLADKSLGATIVKSGDTILWKFEPYVQ